MVRAFTAAAMVLVVSACAPERAPASHRTWHMALDTQNASSCPLQGDGGLDVETWVPRSGLEIIRFVDAPPMQLGRSLPITLPDGLRGAGSNFNWNTTRDITSATQQGQVAQSLSLSLAVTDAGVAGVLNLKSTYTCTSMCDAPPRYPSCDSNIPVRLTEVDLAPFLIEDAATQRQGESMLTVAIDSGGACSEGVPFNEVKFERWSFGKDLVHMPLRSAYLGTYVGSKFEGELTRDGGVWEWASDADVKATPRASMSMSSFDVSTGEAFEGVLQVTVVSSCNSTLCPARACDQRMQIVAMREEKKK